MESFMSKFYELAEKNPEKPALVDQDGKRAMTYGELAELSRKYAAFYLSKGLSNNDIIVVAGARKSEYIAAELGAFHAGCGVAPVNMNYPKERIDMIREDSESPLVMTESLIQKVAAEDICGPVPDQPLIKPDNIAFLIYTSGSTGKPKGIFCDYRTFSKRCTTIVKVPDDEIVLSMAPFYFVATLGNMFACIALNFTIHIASMELMKDIRAIENYIYDYKITRTFLSPQMLRLFRNRSESLRVVATGSEKVTGFEKGNYAVMNAYGMSESLGPVLSYATKDGFYENFPVGKPCSGFEVYLLDDNLLPVKEGEEGQIVVSGCLASGYYKRPEETARVFLDNPFAKDEQHKRMYLTGDIGKIDKNGNIIYVNRKDWMVKINGQRVEPGEIEQQMRQIPEIENAVVKAFTGAGGQSYLCAYYIVKQERQLEEQMIRSFLSKRLAAYMIPAFYVEMKEFPLNQNGKLDRKALKAPELTSFHKDYVEPSNEKEQKLCAAFEKVLQCGKVGVNDDFFTLGGNSINVLMMLSECELEGLTPANVFSGRTPKKIAARIRKKKDLYAECMEEREFYSLTDSQMGVYLECAEKPESTMYNIPLIYRAAGADSLDTLRLKAAVEKALENHPVFGIRIVTAEELPVMQKQEENIQVKLVHIQEDHMAEYIKEFIRPFDLKKDLLCRSEIVQTENSLYLLFDMHHLIFDGTSSTILMEDIIRCYQEENPEAEQLTMFHQSIYEEKLPETEEYQEAAEFFDQKLSGIDIDSNLIPDVILKKEQIPGGNVMHYGLLRDMTPEMINGFLKGNGFTENTLFMAAFAYTLAKFSNQEEVLFSTVNNGRHDVRLNRTIGMMVRTLPVCLKVKESDTPVDFMAMTQEYIMEAMEHDVCGFGKLAQQYSISSDIMFVYQDEMAGSFEVEGTVFRPQPRQIDPQANLTVMVFKRNDEYTMNVEYRKELYTSGLITSFMQVLDGVLSGLMRESSMGNITLSGIQAQNQIDIFNHTETDIDLNRTIVAQFHEQAQRTPDKTAVIYKENRISYKELDDVTKRIGQYTASLGIGPEDVVSILIQRSEYMPICALGVLKSGAAYQPLDASYPPERLSFMVKDSAARLLIADEELLSLLPDYEGKVLLTKDIPELPDTGVLLPEAKPENLFVLLYTSGTTGLPKGCMIENRNIACFIEWYKKYNKLSVESVYAQYASFGFDACMMDMYSTLTAGGTLVIIGDELRLDLAELDRYFQKEGVTTAFMTTQVGRFMAENMKNTTLKNLGFGGEKLVPFEVKGDCVLTNLYGPSETTVVATYCPISENYSDIPIGRALDNLKLYVTDAQGRLLPPGMPGELWIAGPQVSRGYLNRMEQTEKAYTNNPFTQEQGYERVYHSGDIVRYLPDGNIQFIGRRDAQVKIRGFRVELSEVEGVIREYPGIQDATVTAFEEADGGKYIAAYVVSSQKIQVEDLNRFILERKPPYIVPAVTMQIDAIPLNQNDKVNKKALPKPVRKAEEIVPPENEMQQKIFDCAAKAIGQDNFGVTTDLFYAGLTSIGTMKLNGWLSEAFHVTIRNSDIKSNNTVEKLEKFLKQGSEEEYFERQADYPLTQTQQGIFVECMAHPDTTVYNIPIVMKLHPNIDIERLKRAVKAAVNAHPYVKMRLMMNEDGDIRARRLDGDESFEVAEISAANFEEIRDHLLTPFKILGGSLIRAQIIHAESNYFFLEMHHLISDGTSMEIFLRDVSLAYAGEALTTESFTGFENGLSEEKARKGELLEKARDYYTSVFGSCDGECMPIRDVTDQKEEKTDRIIVPGKTVKISQIQDFCNTNRVTMNSFFTTAFGILIARYCGKEEAVFTTIYNGRNDSRLLNTVSMLVKTYPILCAAGDGEKKPVALMNEIQSQMINSMNNDIFSFAEISRAFGIHADIMFAYQGDEFIFDTLCGEKCEMIQLMTDQTKAPINVNVFTNGGELKIFCEYAVNLYSRPFMTRFAEAFEQVILELLCKDQIRKISLLTSQTREMLQKYNDNRAEVDPMLPSELFEKQAALHPDKPAVLSAGEMLTFDQLNRKANRIAHTLINSGVQPEMIVGLMLYRGIDVYPVREGILKSGGAFLSIEPDYPDERISYIIQNSGTQFFITTTVLYEKRRELLDKLQIKVFLLEELYQCEEEDNPKTDVTKENLAYCIYTSGSTGKPKGVMIERQNLMNMLNDCEQNILARDYIDHTSVFLGLAAITFDVSVIEEMMPLYHGQTVAMATEDEIHNPIALADMMLACGVDMMKCTPSYMMTIMDVPEVQEALLKLNAIIIGAEAFPKGLYEKMRAIGMKAVIFNSYGPTETTVTVTIDELDGKNVTIGRACNNVSILMRDSFGNVLPPNVPGELTIIGKSVGRGYIGLPEMTAEKFIQIEGERAYRSGDIAYWNQDGKIEFCGRADNQVKLRGLRVELDEIESVMNTYPGVRRSVVLVKENEAGQYLCGYLMAEKPVDTEKLTTHMEKTLTGYMIPSVFVQLESLPMNNNGKVDKKALPEPEFTQQTVAGKMPVNDLQRKLCEIFALAIGVKQIGIDDDFFKMGGTSLSASKVVMRCMAEHLPVVYSNIFEYTTVEKLEQFIRSQQKQEDEPQKENVVLKEAEQKEYTGIEKVLKYNTTAYLNELEKVELGRILLSGATGFLGIHVLRELIRSDCTQIYCLIRKGERQSIRTRLQTLLMYYFDETFDELIGNRVMLIEGDITDPALKETLASVEFDTLINCAACVKHFANDDMIERINVQGVKNLISICRERDKKLVQISTVSVAGEGEADKISRDRKIYENELYFGQILENKYVESKFRAEKAVLDAVEQGLRGKIIRVGNLMSRDSDGEFQINYRTNGFMTRLRAYAALGKFPVENMDGHAEFSPIDSTAAAIVTLAGTDDRFTVFHAYNCHDVHMANVIAAMNKCGIPIEIVRQPEFQKHFQKVLVDEAKNSRISSLIAYVNNNSQRFFVGSDNSFTTKALYRLGFAWPIIDDTYLEKAITALETLGFFDDTL